MKGVQILAEATIKMARTAASQCFLQQKANPTKPEPGEMCPNKEEGRQKCQVACMCEKGASGHSSAQKGCLQRVEERTSILGRIGHVEVPRDHITKAKAQTDLILSRDIKGNKKRFCRYVSSERKIGERVGPV